MPAPWSDFEEIASHIFKFTSEATRSDFLDICYANDISDDVVDGFDALREGIMFHSAEEVKAALNEIGQLSD
ncbi:MAG: hypothetical protein MKZ81_03140 [Dehalococcoidia bacterium]|nr:hypothetical protein [Dehalococcoidia bacterium]